MIELAAIAAAVGTVKTATELLATLTNIIRSGAKPDDIELERTKLSLERCLLEIERSIFTAQQEHAKLVQEVEQYRASAEKAKKWQDEQERYELKTLASGALAYALRPLQDTSLVPHWLCANCFDAGHKSILQGAGRLGQTGRALGIQIWRCGTCRRDIQLDYTVNPASLAAKEREKGL